MGVRKDGASWKEAVEDGWVPGKNLFEINDAISKGTIVMNLLSDAAQSETWPTIKPQLVKGKVGSLIYELVLAKADIIRLSTSLTVSRPYSKV